MDNFYNPTQFQNPQINQNTQMPNNFNPQNSFARGGMPRNGMARKKARLIPAHFSKKELDQLEGAQGFRLIDKKTGMRSLGDLESILKNPSLGRLIKHSIHNHVEKPEDEHHFLGALVGNPFVQGMAMNAIGNIGKKIGLFNEGGMAGHHVNGGTAQQLAHDGVNGDTEVALVGPHLQHLLNNYAHNTVNPNDGLPQYFSLKKMMGGIAKVFKPAMKVGAGVLSNAMPSLTNVASGALQKKFGGNPFVGDAVNAIGGFAQQGINKMAGNNNVNNPLYKSLGQGVGTTANAFSQGNSFKNSVGQGMQQAGLGMGDNALAGAMQTAGQGLENNLKFKDLAKNTAQSAFDRAGGLGTMANFAGNAIQSKMAGNSMKDALKAGWTPNYQNLAQSGDSLQNSQFAKEMPFAGEDDLPY